MGAHHAVKTHFCLWHRGRTGAEESGLISNASPGYFINWCPNWSHIIYSACHLSQLHECLFGFCQYPHLRDIQGISTNYFMIGHLPSKCYWQDWMKCLMTWLCESCAGELILCHCLHGLCYIESFKQKSFLLLIKIKIYIYRNMCRLLCSCQV